MDGVCPACGIAYAKWKPPQEQTANIEIETVYEDHHEVEDETLKQKIVFWLFEVPDRIDPVVFWSRALAYLIFFIWGWWFIFTWGSWQDIGNSFMHNINLPFHEFGHVIFRPFGYFMTTLGGSLFQIMMPLIVLIVFLKQGDPFEASIMLWWVGQNFIDLSPYISDAEYRGLPLIMGMGEDSHDWGNLLTMMGMVDKAYIFGKTSFAIGSIIIITSFVWGGYILFRQKQNTRPW
jgi:hypothetical protein